jgi:CSLREA domain-containing protein
MKQFDKRQRIAALLILALLLAGFGPTHPAYAATINVTTFADNLTTLGDCSLREAIEAANTDAAVDACPAGSGADAIQLFAGTYTLSLPNIGGDENDNTTGDLDIAGDLTIIGVDGNTVRIDGAGLDRILSIQPGTSIKLRGFELTHGASAADGGAIHNDQGTLILEDVNVTHSTAGGNGGGIYNDHGVLTIFGGIRDNVAGGNGGAVDNNGGTLSISQSQFNNNLAGGNGGAISNNAELTLDRAWIHDNSVSGSSGGDIYNSGAATISNSFIHNGSAPQDGGNIYSGDSMSSLTISNTTIAQGLAVRNGGGLFNDGALALTNVTIAENSATSGGGIYNVENTLPMNLTNTTIVSNTNAPASPGAGILNLGAGLTLKNTLVAFNGTLGNCAGSAAISSAGYNLTSDGTCNFTATGDLINMNPLFGPLQDNGGVRFAFGGAAPSYALLPGSPAINGGTNIGCPAVDQRGLTRPHGTYCDIGAFETNDAPRAVADSYSIDEDTLLAVSAPGLLSNDSDPDNDIITTTLLMPPAHGALTLNQGGAFNYIPSANYHGQDSFSYRIDDGDLISANTLVTLTVISVNDPPIAANDTAGTQIDTTLRIPAAMLLTNDADIEGDLLTLSSVRGNSARGGRVMLVGSDVVYTPPARFIGVDSLIYILSDGNGGTASGTVTVTVGVRLLYLPLARR